MQTVAVKLAIWLLKKQLSLQNKTLLINAILKDFAALPLRDIIQVSDTGSFVINGREINYEERNLLKESAKALRDNRVFGLIQDQVLYKAFTFAVNSSIDFNQIYFSKAAVWWGRTEHELIKLLSDSPDLPS